MRDETAGRFVAELARSGRRRLGLSELWAALAVVEPAAVSSPGRRARLGELISAAERDGLLVAARGTPDVLALPPLPRSVLLASGPAKPASKAPGLVWPPELAWAGSLSLRPDESELLRSVQRFLRDTNPDEPVVPMRERSLQLTGDEKLLEGKLGGRLFEPGRLSPELLCCRRVHPPFVWREVGAAPVLLVVENHDTFHSLGRAIGPDEGVGLLAFGGGNGFVASVGFVAELPRPVARVLYFGDVDLEGLRIPARAGAIAESLALPTVEPAAGLYEALLRVGVRGRGAPVSLSDAREAAAWLPSGLRETVVGLLTGGERLAQEGLGYSHLRHPGPRRAALGLDG